MVWDIRCSKKGMYQRLQLIKFRVIFDFAWHLSQKNASLVKQVQKSVGLYLYIVAFLSDGFYRQVKQISGAHNKADTNPPSKTKKRRSSLRGMAPSVVRFINNGCCLKNWTVGCLRLEGSSLCGLISFAGYPAECHCGFVSGSAHAHLFRGRWWVK